MTPEYQRLIHGERVSGKVIAWESSLGMENVNIMVKHGMVVGQYTLEGDIQYWMPAKVGEHERTTQTNGITRNQPIRQRIPPREI